MFVSCDQCLVGRGTESNECSNNPRVPRPDQASGQALIGSRREMGRLIFDLELNSRLDSPYLGFGVSWESFVAARGRGGELFLLWFSRGSRTGTGSVRVLTKWFSVPPPRLWSMFFVTHSGAYFLY